VNQSELDSENGATYEVEVAKADGSQVDVRLNDAFKVVPSRLTATKTSATRGRTRTTTKPASRTRRPASRTAKIRQASPAARRRPPAS
jgi:hypothetical protein